MELTDDCSRENAEGFHDKDGKACAAERITPMRPRITEENSLVPFTSELFGDDDAFCLQARAFAERQLSNRARCQENLAKGRAVKAARMANGEWLVGHPPYGFSVVNKKLVPDPGEQHILLVMQSLRHQGYSYEHIAQKLAQYHLRNRNGNLFPGENIRALLTRPKKPATLRAMLPEVQKE